MSPLRLPSPLRSLLSYTMLAVIAAAPILLIRHAPRSYVVDLLAAATQPLGLVYTLTALLLLVAGQFRFFAVLAPALALFGGELADDITIWRAAPSTLAHEHVNARAGSAQVLKIGHFNAGEITNTDFAASWINSADLDILFVSQIGQALLKSQEVARALPYRIGASSHLILSKHPLEEAGQTVPVELWDARPRSPTTLFASVSKPTGHRLLLALPTAPSPRTESLWSNGFERMQRSAESIAWLRHTMAIPVIAAGDFNSTPQGVSYRMFQETSGLRDAAAGEFLRAGTWPSFLPPWAGISIDHVFTSGDIAIRGYQVGPALGGDHRPVIVDLLVPGPSG